MNDYKILKKQNKSFWSGKMKNLETFTGLKGSQTYTGEYYAERIDRNTIPDGKYLYFIRHTPQSRMVPEAITKDATLNFMASFVTDKEIEFSENNTILINNYEWLKYELEMIDPLISKTTDEKEKEYYKAYKLTLQHMLEKMPEKETKQIKRKR